MIKLFISFSLMIFIVFGSTPAAQPKVISPLVDEYIWWLPENTETLMVANGPIEIRESEPEDFDDIIRQMAYSSIVIDKGGKIVKRLIGQKLLCSLEGSRKFRSPKSLGSAPFEGCNIYVFDKGFSTVRDSLMQSLESEANSVVKFGEYRVAVYEKRLEEDVWKFYFVSPKPEILLIATNENFLTEVLNRINGKRGGRAFPESLPEWKFINKNASFWALRHYDASNAALDPTSPLTGKPGSGNAPDKQAIGMVAMFEPGSDFIIKYLSTNPRALNIQRKFWISKENQSLPEVRQGRNRSVEIIYANEQKSPMLLLYFSIAFGHAISM